MHAASGRYLGKRAAGALVAALVATAAGCSAGGSDAPTVSGPSTGPTGSPTIRGGPAVTFSGAYPEVAGHATVTKVLATVADRLPAGCIPRTERSDPHLVSVIWRCGTRVAAADVALSGKPLALSDVLRGGYQAYLSSVAAEQFRVEGIAHPDTTDLSTWYLTPAALAVAFPSGIVSYPLASLTPYLAAPSAL